MALSPYGIDLNRIINSANEAHWKKIFEDFEPIIPEINEKIEEINIAIESMNETSSRLSQAALDVGEQTKTLTDKILWLTKIMTIFAGASVIVSIASLIIALLK